MIKKKKLCCRYIFTDVRVKNTSEATGTIVLPISTKALVPSEL